MDTTLAVDDTRAPLRLLRLHEVMHRTGLGRSTVYDLMSWGEFPKPVQLGNTSRVAWVDSEITDWIRARIQARR